MPALKLEHPENSQWMTLLHGMTDPRIFYVNLPRNEPAVTYLELLKVPAPEERDIRYLGVNGELTLIEVHKSTILHPL